MHTAVHTFEIDPDIRRAEMPPNALYHDPSWFRAVVERVMVRAWQGIPHDVVPQAASSLAPASETSIASVA